MCILRILSILIVLFPVLVNGQSHQSLIEKETLKKHIEVLASDSLEGRGTGSRGLIKAQNYLIAEFERLGLMPGNQSSYLENFTLEKRYMGETYLSVGDKCWRNFDEVIFMPSGYFQQEEVEKEVVFGGYGSDEELDKIDLDDRFVVVFIANLMAHTKVGMELNKRGAYGMIAVKSSNDVQQMSTMKSIFRDHYLKDHYGLRDIPNPRDTVSRGKSVVKSVRAVITPRSELKKLMGYSAAKLQKIADRGELTSIPNGKVKVKIEFLTDEMESANVTAFIPGTSEKKIVVTAHYDHLGMSEEGIFNGADDNASGVAGMLQLAEALSGIKDLPYGIEFVAMSAEEPGLLGSKYHVNQPAFNPDEVLININLDMLGRQDEEHRNSDYLYVLGTDQSDSLKELINQLDEVNDEVAIDYRHDQSSGFGGFYSRSDNYSFHQRGILAIFFHTGTHEDYHHPTDTWQKIDYAALENRVKFIEEVLIQLQENAMLLN